MKETMMSFNAKKSFFNSGILSVKSTINYMLVLNKIYAGSTISEFKDDIDFKIGSNCFYNKIFNFFKIDDTFT